MLTFDAFWTALTQLLPFLLGILVYVLVVFNFYHIIANNKVFSLDLAQYAGAGKFFQGVFTTLLWLVEMVLFFPIIAFSWFLLYVLILLIMTQAEITTVLLIAMAVVTTVRVTSYYSEQLAEDVAKLLPLGILAAFLIDPHFLDFSLILGKINTLPLYIELAIYYLGFLMIVELFFRILQQIFPNHHT